ncbi:uncharacterized protein LOC109609353 [Aethina tumida]|uniref:uncharacterized protein LOC109609353 n=1 Tax=Aethina tumida TaxID=116153 RepID=UPI002148ED26|nr:uncharacterized protein LOC109609353 [Aethina tumida]
MEVELGAIRASWLLMLLISPVFSLEGMNAPLHITRQNSGDIFSQGSQTVAGDACSDEMCVGLSSGTAAALSTQERCTCRCHPHLPAFREDLRICVDDIHECVLAPFVGGSTSQQIPFVFLPLKGQIIHPSKEISFAGIRTPVCAVSGAKFLTETGWVDLRNPLDTDVPFRLYRDEGRTFLQWIGEPDLRNKMSGRLVLVYLMCRDLGNNDELTSPVQTLFSPCVSFRVVGTPTKHLNNVSEVAFFPDAHAASNSESSHLSLSEYVAIGICSILLGLIYVASVFLYLHLKKRHASKNDVIDPDSQSLAAAEEGVVKNNPLLSMVAHFAPPDNIYSDSTSSDTDATPDILQNHDEKMKNMQITSALVHPQHHQRSYDHYGNGIELGHQESPSIERLPEENVSIVETLENREDRPETLRAITGTARKKLYFNPAYFEPQLLLAPPPAAIEFLYKIREVITIAKQKMESKRFTPSLIVIPEEDNNPSYDSSYEFTKPVSRRSSVISLKRENSRRKTCTGCPGCEPQDFKTLCGKLPEFPSLAACHNCTTTSDSKQQSIRRWLENVPILKSNSDDISQEETHQGKLPKRLRSPTRSLPPTGVQSPERVMSPRPASERGISPDREHRAVIKAVKPKEKKIVIKPKLSPPPLPEAVKEINNNVIQEENDYDVIPPQETRDVKMNFPPPDMICEAMVVDNKVELNRIPTLTKKQMNAVINELTVHRNNLMNDETTKPDGCSNLIEYETDSLERSVNKGYHTPSEYAEISSSHPSPSLSTALPMDEEMTMRNAIINKKTGNMTISKINMESLQEDDHDYELIVMKKGALLDSGLYRLPELLQRNNGYSLVSEVYVNNGYNYGSTPSTPTGSNCSTLEKRTLKVRYDGGTDKPGKLLIEVEDCPDNYIPVYESDSFEADTLDRKPSKLKLQRFDSVNKENEYIDSLERPHNQILLRTTGSFRKDTVTSVTDDDVSGNFNRVFGSLREIFEAKTKGLMIRQDSNDALNKLNDEEGRLLTLEERHSRRQRKTNGNGGNVQPDVIPPPPHDNTPIYEHPKPPRKVILGENQMPILPPKNGKPRSADQKKTPAPSNETVVDTPEKHVDDDYEICLVQKNKKDGNILTSFIQAEDIILKKGNNDQFILHNTNNSMNFRLPVKTLQSFMSVDDLKNNKNKKTWRTALKPEDSGYLSTDSNDSINKRKTQQSVDNTGGGSETDESLGDGHSESGAESVETHSVFFGRFHRQPMSLPGYGSVDSGVMGVDDGHDSTDSENISYTTVVPVTNGGSLKK